MQLAPYLEQLPIGCFLEISILIHGSFFWLIGCFLLLQSFPGIPFVLMCDNLSSHHQQQAEQLIESFGYLLLYRPTYSPHFAFVESCFVFIKGTLRKHMYVLTLETFPAGLYMQSTK